MDPWAALQSYARLDGSDDAGAPGTPSPEPFRRSVVAGSGRLALARDGFARHCTLLRSATSPDHGHWQPLALWLSAASVELANARAGLLSGSPPKGEGPLADEFLSLQLWTVLTDCGRALFDTRRALEERALSEEQAFDAIEATLAEALRSELGYRHRAGFVLAEPVNLSQLERLLSRTRWLKRHFERVLFLDVESYQVVDRWSGWLSAVTAAIAYLWFVLWQVTLERHPVTVGSGVVAFALITAVVYASRERLKEIGRSWLTGRVQRMFAQRITRYRLPAKEGARGSALVVSARESFSQSSAQRLDSEHAGYGVTRDVTVLRFTNRGSVCAPPSRYAAAARQVRFIYRLDLSGLLPRLHDAVRGLASLDRRTGRVSILDVPRNYDIPLKTVMHLEGGHPQEATFRLTLNKNGLLRVHAEEDTQPESSRSERSPVGAPPAPAGGS
jgi:hypothetical protein